jgi:hypothetical protein
MYKLILNSISGELNNTMILRLADNAIIPFDLANTDYQEYLKWLEEGNTPLPTDEELA